MRWARRARAGSAWRSRSLPAWYGPEVRATFLFLASAGCLVLACGPVGEDGGTGSGGASGSGGGVGAGGGLGSGGTPAGSGGLVASGGGEPSGSSGGAVNQGSGGATSSGGTTPGSGGAGSGGSGTGGSSSGGTTSSGGAGGSGGQASGCEFSGHVEYELNNPESWPSDVTPLITAAMDGAMEWYNCYADLTKSITVNYNPGVPTAEANVDGVLSFGSNKSYMQVATAMHEVAHTLGVAYYPWSELIVDGVWTGPNVDAFMTNLPAEERDPDMYSQRDYITCDSQHFWPYGLNQASEHQSDWSLINNVRIVAAMQLDKQAYLDGL